MSKLFFKLLGPVKEDILKASKLPLDQAIPTFEAYDLFHSTHLPSPFLSFLFTKTC
jgi:hypothetical protein